MKWLRGRSFATALCCASVILGLSAAAFAGDSAHWKQAIEPRDWRFPRDHGAHPGYRTEWWYFTGNLTDGKGNRYGYELTFFREGIRHNRPGADGVWSLYDLYLAHFAITDVSRRRFIADDRVSRTGPGLAGARTDRLHVWLRDWSAAEAVGVPLVLRAKNDVAGLSLDLVPLEPPVIHGEKGISRKGEKPGQASYYVSCPDLETKGLLKTPEEPTGVEVRGVSWFDHEFGSNQLNPDQEGWDWFGLHLSDGRALMLYFLRRTDGSAEPASSGTIIDPSGHYRHLPLSHIRIEVLDRWRSPGSGATYPSRWRIIVPAEGLELVVQPLLEDQELLTPDTTGVTYWEGAVEGKGLSGNRKVTCEGYVELTGYAGKLGGLF